MIPFSWLLQSHFHRVTITSIPHDLCDQIVFSLLSLRVPILFVLMKDAALGASDRE
jgi:hypothetical protein